MMKQDGGLGGLTNEIQFGAGHGQVRRAGAGDFPIAAAGDMHGFLRAFRREESAVSNGPYILSRTILWSVLARTLRGALRVPCMPSLLFELARLTVFTDRHWRE